MPRTPAPTQVLRFDPHGVKPNDEASEPRLTSVYANDGTQISAGTIAAPWRNEFLVGAPRQEGTHLQTPAVNSPTPARGLRPGALLVSGLISLAAH